MPAPNDYEIREKDGIRYQLVPVADLQRGMRSVAWDADGRLVKDETIESVRAGTIYGSTLGPSDGFYVKTSGNQLESQSGRFARFAIVIAPEQLPVVKDVLAFLSDNGCSDLTIYDSERMEAEGCYGAVCGIAYEGWYDWPMEAWAALWTTHQDYELGNVNGWLMAIYPWVPVVIPR